MNNENETKTNLEKLQALVNEYADASATRQKEIFDEAVELVVEVNADEKSDAFGGFLADENPVLAAIKAGFITLTTIKRDTKKNTLKFSDKIEIIDLKELVLLSEKQIIADGRWEVYAEALNYAVVQYKIATFDVGANRLTGKSDRIKDFRLSSAARDLDIKAEGLKTDTGIVAAVQKVVDAIIPGITMILGDANALVGNASGWNNKKVNGIKLSLDSTFRRQLMRVMNANVNKNGYFYM